jgi:hypothetical protein
VGSTEPCASGPISALDTERARTQLKAPWHHRQRYPANHEAFVSLGMQAHLLAVAANALNDGLSRCPVGCRQVRPSWRHEN